MDLAQERHLKRFTPATWALLRYTAKHCPMAKIGGPWLRLARLLQARGFIIVYRCLGGCYCARLTAVGAEALALGTREEGQRIAR
jgi:hypothetical protein